MSLVVDVEVTGDADAVADMAAVAGAMKRLDSWDVGRPTKEAAAVTPPG